MKFVFLFALVFIGFAPSFGQDTTSNGILNNKLAKQLIKSVTRKSVSMNQKDVKSEDVFLPYEGKIIRKIIVKHINFERSIYDTARNVKDIFTKAAEALHSDTRPNIIYNHLFFYANKPLNPYKLADNERYLRDLDFILDSKISVYEVAGTSDSVDVVVTTRDVFSLGIRPRISSYDKYFLSLYDANLLGRGQRLQADFLFEAGRSPVVGKGIGYTKSSIGGSLLNLTAAYTELNRGPSLGEENEYAYYLRVDRPLVSPYSRMAGGVEFSRNWSVNVNNAADSLFRKYRYHTRDFWTGYNIGIRKPASDRSRRFVALRYFRETFDLQPEQEIAKVLRRYNDSHFVLGSITFYKQNFYKTSYVYGFGRTEDVPYGTSATITTGWADEVRLRRAYLGGSISKRNVRPSGRFYGVEAGVGSFFNSDTQPEDGVFYLRANYFSKLYEMRNVKVRHQFAAGYGRAFNTRILELLTLNNQIEGFKPDSLFGTQRIFGRLESTVFPPGQLLGFRFAPFMSIEVANLNQVRTVGIRKETFLGVTGGIRARNENLIFGTVEFRVIYYPNAPVGVDKIGFKFTSNLRIKYSGSFVRPPSFLTYNQ